MSWTLFPPTLTARDGISEGPIQSLAKFKTYDWKMTKRFASRKTDSELKKKPLRVHCVLGVCMRPLTQMI